MKKKYPNYRKTGTSFIEKKLSPKDKKDLQDFLTHCSTDAGLYKVQCRKSELLQIRDIIEKPFSKWNNKDIEGFLAVLNHDSRKPWTKKGLAVTLSVFIKNKFKKDWREKFDNLESIRRFSRKLKPDNSELYSEDQLPTAEDQDKLIRSASSIRDKLYISMQEGGLPPKVQLTAKFKDFKIDSPEPGVTTFHYFRTKNNKKFIFPFGKTVTYYLKQYKQEYPFGKPTEEDFVFPSPTDRNKPVTVTTMWYMFKRLSKKAGIDKNLSQYKFRHKVLSENYNKFPEEVHRQLYGHVPGSKQTGTYSHRHKEEETLQIALDKLHKVQTVTEEQKNKYDREIKLLKDIIKEMVKKKPSLLTIKTAAMLYEGEDPTEG